MSATPFPPRLAPSAGRHIRLALATLIGAMVVAGAVAHLGVEALQRSAERRARLGATAALAASTLRAPPGAMLPSRRGETLRRLNTVGDELNEVAERVAGALIARSAVDALAVVTASGDVVRYWPKVALPAEHLAVPPLTDLSRIADTPGPAGVSTMACAALSDHPHATADGFVCVISAKPPSAAAWSQGAWVATGMVAFGLLGYLGAVTYLRQRVYGPLERISAAGGSDSAGLLAREDEFGALARQINALTQDLHDAREDAQHLRQTMEHTVTRETKQISSQLRRAERVAELDALTGLANRRFIHERLEAVFSEQRARCVNLAVVMLDVDNFKPLNDRAGHAAGDALLRFVGELLRGSLREGDVAIRYGGDEFALVLVDVSGMQARVIAERLVRLFARQAAVAHLPAPVTLSAGVASLDEVAATSGAELLALADDALYRSKRAGKNLVQTARN